jgi:serine/threonine-protein kinase RsbW
MSAFEISYADAPHTCIVRLAGDVDVGVVPELQVGLQEALGGGCENVVLDLADVTYADSSALGLLVWLDRRMLPHHGRLVLAGANHNVSRILEISGLVSVAASIATSDDVSSALGGLDLPSRSSDVLWHEAIEVPLDVNRLSTVRDSVSDLVSPLGFSDGAIFDIKVALGEALANALRHGRPELGEAQVTLGVDAFADRVVLNVTDNGRGFDGAVTSADDVYAPGGRGIMFMHALMDRVEFVRAEGGGTTVQMVKHRPSGTS